MVITLRSQSQPISLVDLHQVKRALRPNPFLQKVGKILKHNFKQTAFYDFLLIASKDPD